MKNIVIALLIVFSSSVSADWGWTNGHYEGEGVGVVDVYPQWDENWLTFKGSDGARYFYDWGNNGMDDRAKTFLSMLLTAQTANKKVSIYKNSSPNSSTWYEFTFLRLHD